MFSASQSRAPILTLCYLSSKMMAKNNQTMNIIDEMDDETREGVIVKKMYDCKAQQTKEANGTKGDPEQNCKERGLATN